MAFAWNQLTGGAQHSRIARNIELCAKCRMVGRPGKPARVHGAADNLDTVPVNVVRHEDFGNGF